MAKKSDIKDYTQSDARNKIVICDSRIEGLTYIDVGYELSCAISKADYTSYDSSLRGILSESKKDAIIGPYLAIENVGMLFEQELHVNIDSIFDYYSKGQTLVICASGRMDESIFSFMSDRRFKVDLSGLSHINLIANL